MLAAYYIQEVNSERSMTVRDRLIQKIIQLYTTADKTLMYNHVRAPTVTSFNIVIIYLNTLECS